MIEELHNRIADGLARYKVKNAERIDAALDIGADLLELRRELQHGDFGPAVDRLGLNRRTARLWMTISRSGLENGNVAVLGGLNATERALNGRQHPINLRASEIHQEIDPGQEAELLEKLTASMRESGFYPFRPILLAPDGEGGAGILDGYLRFQAARKAKVYPAWTVLDGEDAYGAWYRGNMLRGHWSPQQRADAVSRMGMVVKKL